MEDVHVNTTEDVKVFIEEDPLMLDDLDSEECKNYSNPVEATSFTTEELSDVGSLAKIINVECVQDKIIGSRAYEYTSAGVEVFIKEEPLMHEDLDSEECENYSRRVEVASSITDVRTTTTTIKEEYVQDSYNNEQMLRHIGNLCETVYAADHQLNLHPSVNKPQEEFILPDVIDNIHSIEGTFKKEPLSCVETTEASSSSEVNFGPINLKEELGIFSSDADDQSCLPLKRKDYLTLHSQIHSDAKHFTCRLCNKSFLNKQYLVEHQKVHSGRKSLECSECDMGFERKEDLEKHRSLHTLKPYSCSDSDKGFTMKHSTVTHMRTHTGGKWYFCTECDKRFIQKHHLVAHLRTHTGEKPFSCADCHKRFTKKHHLVVHMRTHTGEKPHSCTDCDKRFTEKHHLVAHKRTHTGEKPYPCTDCDKRFTTKHHLVAHMRTHTGEKLYACDDCDKRFTQKQHLIAHMRTHTGEKLYACDNCDKRFTQKQHLIAHMHTHTGEKLYA